jgi:hypothetical protein
MRPGSSRSSARLGQGFSPWRTFSAIGPSGREALAGGRMAWRRSWSLALARTSLWVPASHAALCLPPQHTRAATPIAPKSIWLLTVVVEATPGDEYDRRWGRMTSQSRTEDRQDNYKDNNVWDRKYTYLTCTDECNRQVQISKKWNIQQKLFFLFLKCDANKKTTRTIIFKIGNITVSCVLLVAIDR